MVGGFLEDLEAPPIAVATSSTSYSISWGAAQNPCHADLVWDLHYAKVTEADHWRPLTSSVVGDTYEVFSLRSAIGCVFRARAHGMVGYAGFSRSSAVVATAELPRLGDDSVRLEAQIWSVRLDGGSDTESVITSLLEELDQQDGVCEITFVERRPSSTRGTELVVFDLRSTNSLAHALLLHTQ